MSVNDDQRVDGPDLSEGRRGIGNFGSTAIDDDVLLATEAEICVEDAIDRIGMGNFQRGMMIAAGLCFAADAMEILLLSFLSLVLLVEWDLTDQQSSVITSSVFAGAFLGTLTLGPLTDRIGRKPVFTATAALIAFFGLATSFANTFEQILLFRFAVGFGVGGIVTPFDTLAEFMPTKNRGQRLVTTAYFWTAATIMVPVMAYLTLERTKDGSTESNWRLFVALCSVPCLVSTLVGFFVVPESPRWLLTRGESTRALAILRRAAASNGKHPMVVLPPETVLASQQPESENITCCDLLSDEWYPTTLLLWLLWGCYAFVYYGTVIAVTLVFSKGPAGTSNRDLFEASDDNPHPYKFDYLAMVVSASAEMAGVSLVSASVDRFGRINCMSAFFFSGGILVLALCLLKEVDNTSKSYRMELIALAFLSRMFVYCGSNITWIITAEILPTKIRATGHGVANAVARIGAFLAPFFVSPSEKPSTIGFIMFLVSLVLVICTRSLPETAGQPLGARHSYQSNSIGRSDRRMPVPTEEGHIT